MAEDEAMRMVRHGISNALVLVIQDLAQGLNYHARVRDCTDEGGRRICGAWSNYSDPAFVPIGVDVPRDFRAIPGNGFVTLQWRVERSATEYEIDYPAMKSILTAEHHYTVVPNLLNGTNYTFRVRAKRPGDISAWSDPMTVIPTEVELARPTFPRATGWTRGRTLLRWIEVENAVSYQIQRWDGERDRARWVAMSGLTGQQNQAKVFMGNLAWVAGLEEGTEYSHRIRAGQRSGAVALDRLARSHDPGSGTARRRGGPAVDTPAAEDAAVGTVGAPSRGRHPADVDRAHQPQLHGTTGTEAGAR